MTQKTCLQHAVLQDNGSNLADNFVQNCTLLPRRNGSGSRHLAKPLGRYLSFWDSAYYIETDVFKIFGQNHKRAKKEKTLKMSKLPSLLYRVHFVHTIKQTPRKKWLRHYLLCPPATQSKRTTQLTEFC